MSNPKAQKKNRKIEHYKEREQNINLRKFLSWYKGRIKYNELSVDFEIITRKLKSAKFGSKKQDFTFRKAKTIKKVDVTTKLKSPNSCEWPDQVISIHQTSAKLTEVANLNSNLKYLDERNKKHQYVTAFRVISLQHW